MVDEGGSDRSESLDQSVWKVTFLQTDEKPCLALPYTTKAIVRRSKQVFSSCVYIKHRIFVNIIMMMMMMRFTE